MLKHLFLAVLILASGFALQALDEPTVGLLLLIAIKTAFDVYHWRREEQAEPEEEIDISAEIEKLKSEYPEPQVTINGKDKHFESFQALSRSRE